MEPENNLKNILSKIWLRDSHVWFSLTFSGYILSLIIFYYLSLENKSFYNYLPKSGLVVGAFFPLIAFAYFHRHYLKSQGLKGRKYSIISWFLPALLTQFIVILGFIILLGYPKSDIKQDSTGNKLRFAKDFFSGALHYGQLFKDFQKVRGDIIAKKEFKYEEIANITDLYRSLIDSKTKNTDICPPKEKHKEYLGYCLQKFAQISETIEAIPFKLALTFGFLGALIFSLSDLVIRFNLVDLYPKNFVFYSIRFVVAASLSTTLSNFFMEQFPVIMAPPVFFLIGYFPERAITYLDQKMTEHLGLTTYKPLPLSLVQGMSGEKALRLREMGIEDVQHLAVANVQVMKKDLPYSQDMICDWIAQSLLILYFNKQIEVLRDLGVRTILDLQNCLLASPENEIMECAKKVGINKIQFRHIKKVLATEPMQSRISGLKNYLEKERELIT